MARYKWGPFSFYAGYIYARLMNPTDHYANGFPTIAEGIFVPPGAATSNAYTVNRILNSMWTGVRYSVWSNLDLAAGVYYGTQNDYLPPPSARGRVRASAAANAPAAGAPLRSSSTISP